MSLKKYCDHLSQGGNFTGWLTKVDASASQIPGKYPRSMSSNSSSDSTKMSASVKSSKKTAKTAEPVAVAAPAVAAAPKVAASKAGVSAATKVAAAKAAVPAAGAVNAATAAPAANLASPSAESTVTTEEDVGASLQKSINELQDQLSSLKTAFSAAAATLKVIEKQAARVVKKAERKRKRKADADPNAEPKACIFTKPVRVSDELCSFLGKPKGTEVSRSSVTKAVMAYAHAHTLMDKQQIKADATLRKLLTLTEADKLTILNLQKYLNHHYIKTAPAAV